jgi:hypothetical protein
MDKQRLNMASHLTARYLDPSEYEKWDRFVDTTQLGCIYNQTFFLDPLCQAFGTQFRILAVFKGDQMVGGIALHYNPGKYGDMVHLRPLLYYNGLVIDNFESKYPSITSSRQTEVVNAILDELEGGRYAAAEISSTHSFEDYRPFLNRGWRLWPRYTYVVPIADLSKQWESVEQNLRRLISRCEREGMTLEISDDAELFYAMNKNTYLRKGVEPYLGRDEFIQLHKSLRECNACQIYFALTPDGQRAAAQVVLFSKHPLTHTWMAGSDPQFLQSGASAFLRWKVFEDLNRRGYQYNDLTDAMIDRVARFKSQFGGRLEPSFVIYKDISPRLHREKQIRNFVQPRLDALKRKFQKAPIPSEEQGESS